MALKPLTRSLAFAGLLAALPAAGALAGESGDGDVFGEPPPSTTPAPAPRPVPRPPRLRPHPGEPAPAARGAAHRRWAVSLDFDYRRRELEPVKVNDKFDDFVGNVHFDERLDLDLYASRDFFQTATLGLTGHWRPLRRLDLYFGVRRPLYGKGQHREIEFDGAPIASPRLELDGGASVELAAGFEWEALRAETGPLRGFGLALLSEFRAGWADDVDSPNEETEFDLDGNDDVEYEADWRAADVEMRVFRFFPYSETSGGITAYAGLGGSFLAYHEEWDGEFEDGDETEKMEFDYREKHALFGSFGLRADRGRLRVEVGARLGGEYLLHASAGWRF